ncbi:Catenin alpha-3, partial [Varanus komodoensis]
YSNAEHISHIMPVLYRLHWLPIEIWAQFEVFTSGSSQEADGWEAGWMKDGPASNGNNADKKEKSNALNIAIDNMCKKTRDLRRQLRKAIIDHISDSFLDTTVPLLVLTEAAKNGREKEIKEYAAIFKEHTCRLIE